MRRLPGITPVRRAEEHVSSSARRGQNWPNPVHRPSLLRPSCRKNSRDWNPRKNTYDHCQVIVERNLWSSRKVCCERIFFGVNHGPGRLSPLRRQPYDRTAARPRAEWACSLVRCRADRQVLGAAKWGVRGGVALLCRPRRILNSFEYAVDRGLLDLQRPRALAI